MSSHIEHGRSAELAEEFRLRLVSARKRNGWSQRELGRRVGLPQVHISQIESGKVVPRFNTLLDLVRVLDFDLLLVPRPLVPAIEAMVIDYEHPDRASEDGERPLYAAAARQ
jgi:transcriptional regulator with XRE-family HTH domain